MTAPELDLAAVKATAEAASKGPWEAGKNGSIYGADYAEVIVKGPVECMAYCYGGSSTFDGDNLEADAKHIATMDPSTTLALVDRLEQAEREVERLRGVVAGVEALGRNWLRLSGTAMTDEVREWTAASGRSVLDRLKDPS